MMEDEFEDCDNVSLEEDCDVDLSLLRLSSPPSYDYSHSSASTEASPLKRTSPASEDSTQHKRRRISPLRFTYPETHSRNPNLTTGGKTRCSHSTPVSENQETTTFGFNTEKKMDKEREEEGEETNDDAYQEETEEEDCGEGMRIERSGEGFIIRLKCRCKLAFRVLFSDHHLYFKPL